MSSADLADWHAVHTVTVETYRGRSGAGNDLYDDQVEVPGWLSQRRSLVRGEDGDQVLSSATFSADADHADQFTPGSRVTLPGLPGTSTVITVAVSTGGDVIEGLDRVKVWLQ